MFAKTGSRTDMQARRDATGCKLAHRAKGCVYLTLQYSSHESASYFRNQTGRGRRHVGPMFDSLHCENHAFACISVRMVV